MREPIVATPTDAFKCFMGTDLDIFVIENYVLEKKLQDKNLFEDCKINMFLIRNTHSFNIC